MENKTFVTTVDIQIASKLRADLESQGFEITIPIHTIFSAKKKGISCTLYKSGKLMVQGKEMAPFIEFYLEPNILKSFEFTYKEEPDIDSTGRIGIDESGKGDFFGPLCIAGVFAEGEAITKLKSLGVRDSKTFTDAAILKVAPQIRKQHAHHIVKINPEKYNQLYMQFGNLNHLLAWGHATTIEHLVLKTNCHNVHIDQFADERVVITALRRKKLSVELSQRHRAEEDLVVAAASILARETFLQGLKKLGEEFGIDLPKGASAKTIEVGRLFLKKHGPEALAKVGKMHFKTSGIILNKL